ncbi:MAG: vWA domain-containing protein [Gemmataceae bacterium]
MLQFLARYWFPMALLVLALMLLPAVILYVLNLFGYEGPINTWLQDNFQLSYHIPLPWWGALLLLLVPVGILILYFLKLKRKPLSVPSTFLWKKSIEDLHVNSLIQWLRRNVLLLLQLLTVLGLIFAILAFRFHGRTGEARHYIIMIDNSASMSAKDVQPSRLEVAKQEALKAIAAASDNDFGMVIVFNSTAEIVHSYTNNRAALRNAVRNIPPTQRPTRIEYALEFAGGRANPHRSTEDVAVQPANVEPGKERQLVAAEGLATEVHLFSDGRFADVKDFALGKLNLHYHRIGKEGPENVNNISLATLNASRDEEDPHKLRVFARVLNFRPREAQTRLELRTIRNGQEDPLRRTTTLTVPPRVVREEMDPDTEEPIRRDLPGEAATTFELRDIDDRAHVVLHARLLDAQDDFPLDDEAWLVIGQTRPARVLIVTSGNERLEKFFNSDATRAIAEVRYLTPAQLGDAAYRTPALDGVFDLVIFDRCAPAKVEDLPRANTFFIGRPPPAETPYPITKIDNPYIVGWNHRQPLLKHLTALYEVGIAEAFLMDNVSPRAPRLIEGRKLLPDGKSIEIPLLLALQRRSFTDLVLTFELLTDQGEWNTNWPRQVHFPLFLANVLYTLGNVRDEVVEETTPPGEMKALLPAAGVAVVRVRDPQGGEQTLERGPQGDFRYLHTDQVGVYEARWEPDGRRDFAVNLLDANESNLEPRDFIQIGEQQIAAGSERGFPRELWKWGVAAALVLLMLEWYIYNRRVYI